MVGIGTQRIHGKARNMKITEIQLNPHNPRIIKDAKFKKLVQSIKEFPEMLALRPIVIDENHIVLGGNMRLRACMEAGIEDVPVQIAQGLTEEQKREFIVKDNVGFGEWDWNQLANEWDVELLDHWGLAIPIWTSNMEVNNMTENDIDVDEEFDPIGNASDQTRIVIICKNEDSALKYIVDHLPKDVVYKRQASAGNLQFRIMADE